MRVATATQMAAIDRRTIDGGTRGIDLMERAGNEMVYTLLDLFPGILPPATVSICCGKGNNAGDGLVVGRLLAEFGFTVNVLILAQRDDLSPEALTNLVRLPDSVRIIQPERGSWTETWLEISGESDILVDAVFGTGVKPPLRGEYIELFRNFGLAPAPVVSLDIPSGVDGEDGRVEPTAVRADVTITVGSPKLGLLLPPGRDYTGHMEVVDIGFPETICHQETDDINYLTDEDYAALLPERRSDAHKYDCGTILVLGGSRDFGGAPLLAGLGALRSGAGLVTLALPESHRTAALSVAPEAVVRGLPVGTGGGLAPLAVAVTRSLLAKQAALAVGPGMGSDPATDAFLIDWLAEPDIPMVIDADALNAYSRTGHDPVFKPGQVVITPHAGELTRLIGPDGPDPKADPIAAASAYARRCNAVVVAKGSPTIIAHPKGPVVINSSGTDALAHGGTGDVLTGLIGGLLSQGLSVFKAAILGCRLHGDAGELAAEEGSRRCVTATDVAAFLPQAFADLEACIDCEDAP